MKAVTIARISRTIIVIAILAVLLIPTYGGIKSFEVSNGEFVATDSVYELGNMSESDLSANIQNAITDGSSLKEGYTLSYNGMIGIPVPNDKASIDALAATVMASGAETATLLTPEGAIARQQMINGSNDSSMFIYTGLKLTNATVNMFTPNVVLNMSSNGVVNKISDVRVTKADNMYQIRVEVPYVMVAVAVAEKNPNFNIGIDLSYNTFMRLNLSLDFPLSKFINSDVLPQVNVKSGEVYDEVHTVESIEIKVDIPDIVALKGQDIVIGAFGAADGGIKLMVDDTGKIIVMADKASITESLVNSCNDDGSLTVKYKDDGKDKEYTLDPDMTASLMSMVDLIIESYKEA